MADISVQFKGNDSDRVEQFIKCSKPGTAFTLTHYVVDGDEGEESKEAAKEGKSDKKPKEKKKGM